MQLAWAQARREFGQTWTNPQVGAVLVKNGRVLAQDYHHQYGKHHAEVETLDQLADPALAVGATMVVTLEPCSHYGKTPPCAKRLVAAGVARVVIGQRDPNPLVAGKGIAILEQAGIAVTVLGQTGGLNSAYNFFYQHQRPLVTLKYATSVDGKLNAAGTQRTYLTGPAALRDSQHERAGQQALLIGEQTLLVDDPSLTVRTFAMPYPPVRLVVVRDADRLPEQLHVLTDASAPVWLLSEAPTSRTWPPHVQVHVAAHWTPQAICALVAAHGLQSLQVEGGSRLLAAFLAAGVCDRVVAYVAPLALGGTALPVAQGPAAEPLALHLTAVTQLAEDVKLTYGRNR
jgi:diaminohydroxyphosphoribosylaminopyrimidine deaminase/5-amino-6-(5-phosphoribosylamino)uracil reductase